jgi:hypothetical protein
LIKKLSIPKKIPKHWVCVPHLEVESWILIWSLEAGIGRAVRCRLILRCYFGPVRLGTTFWAPFRWCDSATPPLLSAGQAVNDLGEKLMILAVENARFSPAAADKAPKERKFVELRRLGMSKSSPVRTKASSTKNWAIQSSKPRLLADGKIPSRPNARIDEKSLAVGYSV